MSRGAFDVGIGQSILGGFQVGLQGLGFQLRQQQFQANQAEAVRERQEQEAEVAASGRNLLDQFDQFNPAPFSQQFPTTPEGGQASGPPIQFQDFENKDFAQNRSRFQGLPREAQEREIRVEQDFALKQRINDQIIQQSEEKLLSDISAIRESSVPEDDKDRAIRSKVDAHDDLSERTRISILGDQAFDQPTAAEDLTPEQVQQQALAAGLSPSEANLLALQVSLGGNLTQSAISSVRNQSLKGQEAFVNIAGGQYEAALSELQSAEKGRGIIASEGTASAQERANAERRVQVARAKADDAFNEFNRLNLGLAEALSSPVSAGFLDQFDNDPALEPVSDLSQTTLPSGGDPEFGPQPPQSAAVAPPPIAGDAITTPEGSIPGNEPLAQIRVAPRGTSPGHETLGFTILTGPRGMVAVDIPKAQRATDLAKVQFLQEHGRVPSSGELARLAIELAYEEADGGQGGF